jgi:HNH endonuclease
MAHGIRDSTPECSVAGCGAPGTRKGLCNKHRQRVARHGTIDRPPLRDPALRFWPKVDKHGPIPEHRPDLGPCWVWTATTNKKGYGRFNIGGKLHQAHRVAYELLIGPVPAGLLPDHLCRNSSCVNPAHLEIVTNRENTLRGAGASASNARKTHCPKGHPYDRANTYRRPDGGRECRICKQVRGASA